MSKILKILYILVEDEYDAVLSIPSIFAYGFFACPQLSLSFGGFFREGGKGMDKAWTEGGRKGRV